MLRFRACTTVAAVLVTLTLSAALTGCGKSEQAPTGAAIGGNAPEWVGAAACADCHRTQFAAWRGSHHDLAMQRASSATVLGDFSGVEFTHHGVTSTFFQRDGGFFVRTDGPDGTLVEYPIAYAFGAAPLQQYLIEFPGGRLQALSLSWDARPVEAGGQRWFHLYQDQAIDHTDPLHWTATSQNWNYMCAECHSTNLRKGYDATTGDYDTTWSEIDVACEACHGPGSAHVAWAEAGGTGAAQGLTVRLGDSDEGFWRLEPGALTATRSVPRTSRTEIATCAPCHSRRGQFDDEENPGRPLTDGHRLAVLDADLYHADGQILDEVYVYGSFLQSRMYREGVTCSDCHDAHRADLISAGNATCVRCHAASAFDTPDHHHHKVDDTGGDCVACHMPVRDYMVVDPRHDHSFRVPRPDLSLSLGTPNTCNDCHADRSAGWAADHVASWYPPEEGPPAHYGEALQAGRLRSVDALARLSTLIDDEESPGIARATALGLLPRVPTVVTMERIQRSLTDPDPLVRAAALSALQAYPAEQRWSVAGPSLGDGDRSVRMEAAQLLVEVSEHSRSAQDRLMLDTAVTELKRSLEFNADRPEGRMNLGNLDLALGDLEAAEVNYRAALELDPNFAPASVNLADAYRLRGRDDEGELVLRQAIERTPDHGGLRHAMGLLLVRRKRSGEALSHFQRAAELRPDLVGYVYAYGLSLHGEGRIDDALAVLEAAHMNHPTAREPLLALAAFQRDAGNRQEAARWVVKLLELSPNDPEAQALLRDLGLSMTDPG